MTHTELADETEALSDQVLGVIGGYPMGAALDARDLYTKALAGVPSPDLVSVPAGDTHDGIHLGGHSGTPEPVRKV